MYVLKNPKANVPSIKQYVKEVYRILLHAYATECNIISIYPSRSLFPQKSSASPVCAISATQYHNPRQRYTHTNTQKRWSGQSMDWRHCFRHYHSKYLTYKFNIHNINTELETQSSFLLWLHTN